MQSSAGITNLLREARTECRGAVAFAAITEDGGDPDITTFPAPGMPGALEVDALGEVVRQTSLDPEYGHGRTFVRTVAVDQPLMLAVAPLRGEAGRGMVGVVGQEGGTFEPGQLASLDRVAQRLGRHLRARHEVSHRAGRSEGPDVWEGLGEAGAPWVSARNGIGDGLARVAAAPSTPPQWPITEQAHPAAPAAGTGTAGAGAAPPAPAAPPSPPAPAGAPAPQGPTPVDVAAWTQDDQLPGLCGLGQFFSRTGRLLGSEARAACAVAVVLVEVVAPDGDDLALASRALRAQLRFSDPLARIRPSTFASVVVLFPGSTRGDAVEGRLAGAVRSALGHGRDVHSAHVVAEPGDRREVDQLLAHALTTLRAR